jgi:transglutaminase-like putative cysteine protease
VNERNLEPTRILDYKSASVRYFAASLSAESQIGFLRSAHRAIAELIVPVYTIREHQPVSQTITRGRGSCSQRLACLEALARSKGIGTRVRGFWVSGEFWNQRFPLSRCLIPRRVLLAWPQFWLEGAWSGVEETFERLENLAEHSSAFANDANAETLFEAIRTTAVDFEGRTQGCSTNCDLSKYIVDNGGVFDTRDELFTRMGTLEETWRGRAFELLYAGRKSA